MDMIYDYLKVTSSSALVYISLLVKTSQYVANGTHRVNGNSAVKVLLGCAHLDRYAKSLSHLPNTITEDMQADDLLVRQDSHQFELGRVLFLLFRRETILLSEEGRSQPPRITGDLHIVIHGRKLCVVDLDFVLAIFLNGLWLCQPRGTDFWVREHHRWNQIVVQERLFQLWRTK